MAFHTNDVADPKIDHIRADINKLAYEFMACRRRDLDRRLRPSVPVVNMQVSAAYPALFDADHHVVYTHFRLGHVLDPQARLGLALNNSFHRFR